METDSLWTGEIDDELKRSTRHIYARAAFVEFVEGRINEKRFIKSLQGLLCVAETNAQYTFGKRKFNAKDRELIGELIQLSTLPKPKIVKRERGNVASSFLLADQAKTLAILLRKERPDALRKEVELRVYQLMAIDRGEFIQSRRTIERWLAPFFLIRNKKRTVK